MSTTPNNPFETNPNLGDTQGPQKSGSNVWIWVLGIIGGIILVGGLVCCGGAFFAFRAGTGMVAEAFKQQLEGNPVIDEHIGSIESLDMNITATGELAEESQGAIVFDIEGSKGSGTILIKQDPGAVNGVGIASAELRMSDGSKYPVPMDEFGMPPDEMDDIEIDLGDVDDLIEETEQRLENTEAALDAATSP